MRFFLDNDVPKSVGNMLRRHGHECWTARGAGLAANEDDNLTQYAHSRKAVLVTLDVEFSQRRQRNAIGWHVWLRCIEPEAAVVLETNLDDVLALLHREHVTIRISKDSIDHDSDWQ